MKPYLFYAVKQSAAIPYAIEYLEQAGYRFAPEPSREVTHLLLPVPSTDPDGALQLLQALPQVTVIGGKLDFLGERSRIDLLQDPVYVAENAYITAQCAVGLLLERLPDTLRRCPILIIGWGRIGKCLCALLRSLEADVTVAARKEADRAMIRALGFRAMDTRQLQDDGYAVIFNTVPEMLLPQPPENCLKIDLASTPGLGGADVIHARGLPGKLAPQASGKLIARRITEILAQEDT